MCASPDTLKYKSVSRCPFRSLTVCLRGKAWAVMKVRVIERKREQTELCNTCVRETDWQQATKIVLKHLSATLCAYVGAVSRSAQKHLHWETEHAHLLPTWGDTRQQMPFTVHKAICAAVSKDIQCVCFCVSVLSVCTGTCKETGEALIIDRMIVFRSSGGKGKAISSCDFPTDIMCVKRSMKTHEGDILKSDINSYYIHVVHWFLFFWLR